MEIKEIIYELTCLEGNKFPRQALKEAIAQKEQITPELLNILKENAKPDAEVWHNYDYTAHLYALFLLAQFREKRAYPVIVAFFSIPGEEPLTATGDFVTESLGRVLASVCHGDMNLIKKMVKNEEINEYTRSAALQSFLVLVAEGDMPRELVIGYFQSLFRGGLERKLSNIWNSLVSCSTTLYPLELLSDIEKAYQEDLVDSFYISLKMVKRQASKRKSKVMENLKNNTRYSYLRDTIQELETWACFRE